MVHFMGVIHETSPRVAKKRELKTEAILDEAMRVLATDGLDNLTLGRLAEALGYVPAALYRYFASKDALLAALQRRAVVIVDGEVRAALTAIDERTKDEKADKGHAESLAPILEMAHVYVQLPKTHPEAWFLVAILLGDPRLLLSDEESRKTAPLLAALLGAVHQRFVQAAASGALHEGDSTARTLAFWAALQGALTLSKARRISPELPEAAVIADLATTSMLGGWGAERSALERANAMTTKGRSR
ncbi:TetR/AcrR family transcriptional regulator [soil metagenome]